MSIEAKLYTADGKQSGTIALDSRFFERAVDMGLVHRLLLLQRANARIPLAHTKTRGERRGSTRKLYRQKGTGNARAGALRSPVRKGGGIVFGPRSNRNFTIRMNKKERRLALAMLLSDKASNAQIKVLESLWDAAKTKDAKTLFAAMGVENAVVAVAPGAESEFRAIRNLPTVKALNVRYLNPADLLKYRELVFTREALARLGETHTDSSSS